MPRRSAAQRTYETDQIRVWDSTRCIHSVRCLNALPQVFDVQRRPWVDIEGADPDAIAEGVLTCPTGRPAPDPFTALIAGVPDDDPVAYVRRLGEDVAPRVRELAGGG